MSDRATVKALRDTDNQSAHLLCCTSDGSGESAVQKIDISALKMAANKTRIKKLKWSISGQMTVELLFDHSSDDSAIILAGNGELDEVKDGPILDPGSSGGTGDILLTSKVTASTVGQGYTIYIELAKVS
jgi:hypothetical protein